MPTSSLSPGSFRRVMGCFPTGVAVITVEHEVGRVHGMTANSLTSVSLEPLLILICVDGKARLHRYLKIQARFGVNILDATQQRVSEYFAQPDQDHEEEIRLGIRFAWTASGIPLLEQALAHMTCTVVEQHPAGDHTIFIAEVQWMKGREGEPLVHHRGKYRALKSD